MRNKLVKIILVVVAAQCCPRYCNSQGTFVNLDFENPIMPLVPDATLRVLIENAAPGRTGYLGGNVASLAFYNTVSLGAPAISIHGPGSTQSPFQGSYSLMLQPSQFGGQSSISAAIGQTGQIPPASRSLIFYGTAAGQFAVSFAGESLSILNFGDAGHGYRMYAADVSQYAGMSGELRFTALHNPQLKLDAIQFSSTPVPEPGTWALFGLGGALLCCSRWRKGK